MILGARKAGRCPVASWSAHDLRRTVFTNMARLGVAPIVLAHVANHQSAVRGGITFAVYVQYNYGKEKREALELWAERLIALIGQQPVARVVELRRA
jgi:hypothetical protein